MDWVDSTRGPSSPLPRIYILTSEDPLYSVAIIEAVLKEFQGQIVGVAFVSGLFSWKRLFVSPWIYGFWKFFKLSSRMVSDHFQGGKIERCCRQNGITIDHFTSVSDGALLGRLESLSVDMLLSVNCNKRLKKDVIAFPRHGVLNIHNALLPAYRGLMPLVHAIANREPVVGVTVHLIDAKLDTGPIIQQERVAVLPTEDLFALWQRCVEIGARLLPTAIHEILEGTAVPMPNGPEGSSYFSFPTFEQLIRYRKEDFRRKLRRLFQVRA